MARVTEDNFAALKQNWMIVGRVSGKSGIQRQRPKCRADVIESSSLNQSKARVPGGQTTKQRDKSRTEQQQACCRPFRKGPTPDDVAPQERQNKKVAPHHKFEIVPLPWGGLNEVAENENHDCRQHESDIRWRPVAPTPLAFPNTPDAQSNKPQCQRHP